MDLVAQLNISNQNLKTNELHTIQLNATIEEFKKKNQELENYISKVEEANKKLILISTKKVKNRIVEEDESLTPRPNLNSVTS